MIITYNKCNHIKGVVNSMPGIVIRKCMRDDEQGIMNVCYRTGYMGEELTGRDLFNDVKLFGYLFCIYYVRYETDNCFAAVDTEHGDKIVGYILGTDNSKKESIHSSIKLGWRIVLRLLFYTLFKYPESFRATLHFLKSAFTGSPAGLYDYYPAHLHINVLPEYQHSGVGSMLLKRFEEHMKKMGVAGIHLKTSNKNQKAVPFYKKKGYSLIWESESELWKGVMGYKSLIFAKKL
jgi:Acetyltransferases